MTSMDKQTLFIDGTYDSKTVAGLISLDDDQFLDELITIFTTNTPKYLEQLALFYSKRDAWEMRQVLHKMKGTCGTLGTKKMLAAIDTMRSGLLEENWAIVDAKLTEINNVWNATFPYLRLIYNLD